MAVPLSPLASPPAGSGPATRSTYEELASTGPDTIVCLWIGSPGWSPRSMRLLPDGCVDVVWDGNTIHVVPPRAAVARHTLTAQGQTVGVRLRPGWAAPILRAPVGSLPAVMDLSELHGDLPVATLAQTLAEAPSPLVAVQMLARRLASTEGSADRHVLAAVDRLSQPGFSVQATSAHVGLSVRELRRRFHDQVGLTPKAFQRVVRFQRFRRLVTGIHPPATMAQAAAICGYTDQAHLAHDCHELADSTPTALARAQLTAR